MLGPPSGSRHNWLLESVLEKIWPTVGQEPCVPFRHMPHHERSAIKTDKTNRAGFARQKPGEAGSLETSRTGSIETH